MILVDTTVWIDFFANQNSMHAAILQDFLENNEDICLCGIIFTEVLQGIRDDSVFLQTKEYFEDLIYLPTNKAIYIKSAEIYRSLRKKGLTIRKPIDCMIASVAIEHNIPLLHNDRDFNYIAKYTTLNNFEVKKH